MSSPDPAAADLVRRFADVWRHPVVDHFLAMLAPDVRLLHHPGADHYVMEERPAEVLAALARWLAR